MNSAKQIIKKWYETLKFPKEYDEEFYELLKNTVINPEITLENYDISSEDGKKNLLYFLYFCEKTQNLYREKNINEKYLLETLYDIVTYTKLWTEVKETLYLGELYWLKRHLSLNIFKIGRLQFAFGNAEHTDKEKCLNKGDNILEIHITEKEHFDINECKKSIEMAKEFFKNHFPDYNYNFFTCHSWLLGNTTLSLLKPESNISKFANMFNIITYTKSDEILRYIFKWNTNRNNVSECEATSSLAIKVKKMALNNEPFTEGYGIIEKNKY